MTIETGPVLSSSMSKMRELFEPGRWPARMGLEHGYLDLLGEDDPAGGRPGQRLMRTRLVPLIYQRLWRPIGVRLLMGLGGPGTAEEHRLALRMLSISAGERVLDLACGPGNFTRDFARAAGPGLVVGVDASRTMLAVAAHQTERDNVAYLRADACRLPFRDGSFDAVCCFAALYLIEEPERALDEIVRVLSPGGRVALLSTCNRGPVPTPAANAVVRGLSGLRVFDHDELTRGLAERGVADVEQRITGLAQFVSGRARPDLNMLL